MKKDLKRLKDQLREPPPPRPQPDPAKGLSTGSTLLNLALTGRPFVGFLPGNIHILAGASQSGKTFLALTCLAEAARNPLYKKHRLIWDNNEGGDQMDHRHFFGAALVERLEPPSPQGPSRTVEELYDNLDDVLEGPCVYVLDSMDGLTSEKDQEQFQEEKQARRSGKAPPGSYGMAKAKRNTSGLRLTQNKLRQRQDSLFIIIAQRHQELTFRGPRKAIRGGLSLGFFSSILIWCSPLKELTKTERGVEWEIGSLIEFKPDKVRTNGFFTAVQVPHLRDLGLDDTGSCVDFLVSTKHWTKSGKDIAAKELGLTLPREELLRTLEETGKLKELRLLVAEVWEEIESACRSQRPQRYA